MRALPRPLPLLLGCALLAGCVGEPGPAATYVATPVVVAPAPVGAPVAAVPLAEPSATASIAPGTPYGGTCYAGFYVCRLPASLPIGSGCSCPGLGAPSYGVVR